VNTKPLKTKAAQTQFSVAILKSWTNQPIKQWHSFIFRRPD